jgi:hypothetical protein
MVHCPQCGTPTTPAAAACSLCGFALVRSHAPPQGQSPQAGPPTAPGGHAVPGTAPGAMAAPPAAPPGPAGPPLPVPTRTMVGMSPVRPMIADISGAPGGRPPQTIVGMPANVMVPMLPRLQEQADPGNPMLLETAIDGTRLPPDARGAPDPVAAGGAARTIVGMPRVALPGLYPAENTPIQGSPANRTIAGGIAPAGASRPQAGAMLSGPIPPQGGSRTMIGVAMPGIAPLNPGAELEPEPAIPGDYRPASELGATVAPVRTWQPDLARSEQRDYRRHRLPIPRSKPKPEPKRAIYVLAAAGALVLAAGIVWLFWPSVPPLSARARVDAEGREVVEVQCPGCPDGTKISIGGGEAIVAKQFAAVPVAAPLSVGENLLKIAVDRPERGRDETLSVPVNIAYRIRPDLLTLQGERPSIQVVMEAVTGVSIALDGKNIPLVNGRAIETIDVTDACTGLSDDSSTLNRQIPYAVTLPGGTEQGTMNVAVGILPLHIDAPGPHAVIDGKNFVLAGRTSKGAEVLAAGRPIPVRPDGTFAQVMNVSSVGATQIEVRTKMVGKAPRLTRIGVHRVDSLETAAAEFTRQSPISYAAMAQNLTAAIGKPAVISGEVVEARLQNYQTILLLEVPKASGCAPKAGGKEAEPCHVRLVHGADSGAKRGDLLTAYGRALRPFPVKGKADIPEVQVDFILKGIR